jgi:hypothetical protein
MNETVTNAVALASTIVITSYRYTRYEWMISGVATMTVVVAVLLISVNFDSEAV